MLFLVRDYLLQLEFTTRLLLLLIANVFLVVYVRRVVAPLPPGFPRLKRSIPVLFTVLFMSILFDPYLEEEFLIAFQTTVNALWLTLWKVLALCLNRGQLVKALDSGNFPAFVLGLLFPINVDYLTIPVDKKSQLPGKEGAFEDVRFSVIRFNVREFLTEFVKLVLLIITKILTLLCMEYGTRLFFDFPYARDVCFSFFVYALTSFLQDLFNFVVLLTMQLKLGSNFNCPVLSQSVSEFWSKRYNLVMNATLRNLIYDPICEGRWVASRRYLEWAEISYTKKTIAVLVTFFASAVVHIFVGMNILRMEFPVLFSLFFLFNGMVICVEKLLKGYMGKTRMERITGTRLYPVWSRLYVYGVVFSLAHWFFWPDTIECGLAEKMLSGVVAVFGRL